MELRQIALEVARILQDAGKHALNDQTNPHDMRRLEVSEDCFHFTSNTDERLQQFISNRLTYVDVFDGFWQLRPEQCYPGQRYWCVGGIDGVINFARNMPEWTITVTLFEFNDQCSAQPILSVVHAPALGLTYLAVRGSGAIRIRKTPLGDKREKIIPSTTSSLDGSVVSFGSPRYRPNRSARSMWWRRSPDVLPILNVSARRPLICARWPMARTTRISNRTCMNGTYLPCLPVPW